MFLRVLYAFNSMNKKLYNSVYTEHISSLALCFILQDSFNLNDVAFVIDKSRFEIFELKDYFI